MPNSPECQPIADALARLNVQQQTQLNDLKGLAGVDKWKALQALGTLQQQIAAQQSLLDQCEQKHAADLTITIDVTDVPGTTGANRIARIWQLASNGPVVKQTATVQKNAVTFSGVLGSARQSLGVTIEGADDPAVNGPDFRSGALPPAPVPPAVDPASRVEIVILDPLVISTDVMMQAAPALPIQGAVGAVSYTVTQLQFVVANGTVALSAGGTAAALGATSPFTLQGSVHIAPSFGMAPSVILEVSPDASPQLVMSGFVGSIVHLFGQAVSVQLNLVVQQLGVVLNNFVAKQAASVLGLSVVPSGSVLSIRELTTAANSVTVTPVLAAFGTVLSKFQPSPPVISPKLASLTVQPSSISTSDPLNNVAQGRVTLGAPAPAGGITVQLSCDRPDLVATNPSPLTVAEGAAVGNFTVTGIEQSFVPNTIVDVTVTAALGDQKLTAPLAVTPETPATPPPATTNSTPVVTPVPPPTVSAPPTSVGNTPSQSSAETIRGPVIVNIGAGSVSSVEKATDGAGAKVSSPPKATT